jgi:hypothetical protein
VDAEVPVAKEVPPTAVERARAFGIDVTLLLENLNLTPEQRLEKAHRAAVSLASLRAEAGRRGGTVRKAG